jgi:hypothetical protein
VGSSVDARQGASDPADGDRPLDGRPPRICVAMANKCRPAVTQRTERSDNTIRS